MLPGRRLLPRRREPGWASRLAAWFLVSCIAVPATAADQPVHTVASNGQELTVLLKAAGDGTVLSFLTIDPRRHRLDIALAREEGATLRQFLGHAGASIAFTGGYLRTFSPPAPTGYLRIDGRERNGLVRDDAVVNAVLCFGRGEGEATAVRLAAARRFRPRAADEDCLQAGPLLIDGGEAVFDLGRADRLDRLSGAFERAFLALDGEGAVILGVSSATPLQRLRDLLLASREGGGLGVRSAVILTGSTTAGMEVGGGLGYSFGTTTTPLPNAILVDADAPG
jgi:hypothetical protein